MTTHIAIKLTITGPAAIVSHCRDVVFLRDSSDIPFGVYDQQLQLLDRLREAINEELEFEARLLQSQVDKMQKQIQSMASQVDFRRIIPIPYFIQDDRCPVGTRNLSQWSKDNWGTARNAYHTRVLEDEAERLDVLFQTAYSYPEKVIRALAMAFPELDFYVKYIATTFDFWGTEERESGKDWQCNLQTARTTEDGSDGFVLRRELGLELLGYNPDEFGE